MEACNRGGKPLLGINYTAHSNLRLDKNAACQTDASLLFCGRRFIM